VLGALRVTAVLVMGILKGTIQNDRQQEMLANAPEAEMKLTDMEYSEMRDGRRMWSLKASEARYYQESRKTLLKSVHLTFYSKNGDVGYLESEEGVLYAETKNIELWASVRVNMPHGYSFVTERALFEQSRNIIRSEEPIRLTGPEIQLEGSPWEYNFQEQKAVITGGVRATVVFMSEDNNRSVRRR